MITHPTKVTDLLRHQEQPPLPLPPRTAGWPLIGALPALLQQQSDFLTNARAEYGDSYILDLGLFKAIMLNHPAHVQHVLHDADQAPLLGTRSTFVLTEGVRAPN